MTEETSRNGNTTRYSYDHPAVTCRQGDRTRRAENNAKPVRSTAGLHGLLGVHDAV
nr:hypothetical protein [Escherichia coli]